MQVAKNIKKFSSVLELIHQLPDEKTCKMHLAALRWPTNKDLYCPHCGSMDKIYVFKDKITYKCSACLQKFNARTGTVYEGSKIPLQKWFVAIYLMTSHKKGISSIQLAKDIHVTQTTAWFMAHRIRHGASVKNWDNAFSKVVEIDETYIGSRLKNKHFLQRKAIDNYSSHLIKTIVFGMIERDGKVFAKVVPDVKQATIIPIIEKVVQDNVTIYTDTAHIYNPLKKTHDHHRVNHGRGEYVRDKVHTNSIENFWSHLKRGIYGIYHHASKKHMNRYVSEFMFRYNTRKMNEYDRFNHSLVESIGKITYKELIAD